MRALGVAKLRAVDGITRFDASMANIGG